MDKNGEPNQLSKEFRDLMTLQGAIRIALLQCGCPEDVSMEFAATTLDTMAQSITMKDEYRKAYESI